MSDDESFASRRRRRRMVDSDEEEDSMSFASRRRQQRQESEEEAPPMRRFGRKQSSEEEEEEESTPIVNNHSSSSPGTAFSKLPDAKKKKIQQQLIEGMFKYAESKYGRKRPQRGEKQNAMEDYDLYLRSMKAKVKTASDKVATITRQKKEIDAKVAAAEKEFQLQQGKLDKAEEEKNNAINEGRDPELPKDFIVPQRAKKASAGLGALVMKASSKMWEDQFSAMRSKKQSSKTPEWLAKQKKSDKTSAILAVGKKKSDGGRRRKKDEEAAPNPFKVSLKKTGLRTEEEENKPEKKTTQKTSLKQAAPEPKPEPEPVAAPEKEEEEEEEEDRFSMRRRQRRRYDSDEEFSI